MQHSDCILRSQSDAKAQMQQPGLRHCIVQLLEGAHVSPLIVPSHPNEQTSAAVCLCANKILQAEMLWLCNVT